MTKLPKIEKCVCGRAGFIMPDGTFVRCRRAVCWRGPFVFSAPTDAIRAWNAVMRAAKAAELAKRATRRRSQVKAAKKPRAK